MYEQFYGLAERPFDLTPNPRYLLLTPSHREALANLDYGISARAGLIVVTGEAGTGKTTLLRRVMSKGVSGPSRARNVRTVYLANPTLDRSEFVEYLARGFGLPQEALASKARLLAELEQVLVAFRRADTFVALIIDEAQSLPYELMEEVRLLANIESDTDKLLPVVLVGQPELADRLNERALRQLKQRVALRCRIDPLDLHQTAAYIAHRLTLAGGDPASVFSRESVIAIYERSRGIPRLDQRDLRQRLAQRLRARSAADRLGSDRRGRRRFRPHPRVGIDRLVTRSSRWRRRFTARERAETKTTPLTPRPPAMHRRDRCDGANRSGDSREQSHPIRSARHIRPVTPMLNLAKCWISTRGSD